MGHSTFLSYYFAALGNALCELTFAISLLAVIAQSFTISAGSYPSSLVTVAQRFLVSELNVAILYVT